MSAYCFVRSPVGPTATDCSRPLRAAPWLLNVIATHHHPFFPNSEQALRPRPWRAGTAPHQIFAMPRELTALRERSVSDLHLLVMDFCPQAEINQLLVKAGRLRRAATATSMTEYRAMMLRVARDSSSAAIERSQGTRL